MILEIKSPNPNPSIRKWLSYATSRVDQAYNEYSFEENQHLFGLVDEGEIVGCIGVVMALDSFEIKHIEQGDWQRNDGVGM